MDKQTRIFAPFTDAYPPENWYENILAKIIKPITEKWDQDWFWFSRYVHALGNNDNEENCDVGEVNGVYVNTGYHNITTSIRFRYSINNENLGAFEDDLTQLSHDNGCLITDFRVWDKVGDVGSGRHLGGQVTDERRERRAERNTRLYHQISLLTLDTLVGPDANHNYSIEVNNSQGDPPSHQYQPSSSFHTPHHLFCNITGATFPVWITVTQQAGVMNLKTETGYDGSDYHGGPFPINNNPKPMVVRF